MSNNEQTPTEGSTFTPRGQQSKNEKVRKFISEHKKSLGILTGIAFVAAGFEYGINYYHTQQVDHQEAAYSQLFSSHGLRPVSVSVTKSGKKYNFSTTPTNKPLTFSDIHGKYFANTVVGPAAPCGVLADINPNSTKNWGTTGAPYLMSETKTVNAPNNVVMSTQQNTSHITTESQLEAGLKKILEEPGNSCAAALIHTYNTHSAS